MIYEDIFQVLAAHGREHKIKQYLWEQRQEIDKLKQDLPKLISEQSAWSKYEGIVEGVKESLSYQLKLRPEEEIKQKFQHFPYQRAKFEKFKQAIEKYRVGDTYYFPQQKELLSKLADYADTKETTLSGQLLKYLKKVKKEEKEIRPIRLYMGRKKDVDKFGDPIKIVAGDINLKVMDIVESYQSPPRAYFDKTNITRAAELLDTETNKIKTRMQEMRGKTTEFIKKLEQIIPIEPI